MENSSDTYREPLSNLHKMYEQLLELEWSSFGNLAPEELNKTLEDIANRVASAFAPFSESAKKGIQPPVDEMRKIHAGYRERFEHASNGSGKFVMEAHPGYVWGDMRKWINRVNYEYLLSQYTQTGPCNCDIMLQARTGDKPSSDKLKELSSRHPADSVEEIILQCGHCNTKWVHMIRNGEKHTWIRYDL